jgi:alpha-methylacyl-CoA racemase
MDPGGWEYLRNVFTDRFKQKTQKEWTEIFDQRDACVTPVLKLGEIMEHRHNQERALVQDPGTTGVQVASAPRFSRTPGVGVDGVGYPSEEGTIGLEAMLREWERYSTTRAE